MSDRTADREPTRVFTCLEPGCSFVTEYSHTLKRHHLRFHQPATYAKYKASLPTLTCTFGNCEFRTRGGENLRRHVMRCHSGSTCKTLSCTYPSCDFVTKFDYNLRRHWKRRHGLRAFECRRLPESGILTEGSHPVENNASHLPSRLGQTTENPSIYPAPACSYDSSSDQPSLSRLALELRSMSGKKKYVCEVAGCTFETRKCTDMNRHRLKHARSAKLRKNHLRVFICPEAGCSFASRDLFVLKYHKLSTHSPAKKKYQCPDCCFSTDNKTVIRYHKRHHSKSGVAMTSFSCSFPNCGYRAMRSDVLKKHLKTHDPHAREFACPKCPKSYRYRDLLLRHMKASHRTGSDAPEVVSATSVISRVEKRFVCLASDCASRFYSQEELTQHMETEHASLFSATFPSSFAGHSSDTKDRQGAQQHETSDEKNRPLYRCAQCSKSFTRLTSLDYHIVAVHKDEILCASSQSQENLKVGVSDGTDRKERKGSSAVSSRDTKRHRRKGRKRSKKHRKTRDVGTSTSPSLKLQVGRTAAALTAQTHTEHGTENSCEYCEYTSRLSSYVRRHFATHSECHRSTADEQERSSVALRCNQCSFVGDSDLSMLKHSVTHREVVIVLRRIAIRYR